MDLKECYEAMGGSYTRVMQRLAKEERVQRFLTLFLKDGSFQTLEQAMDARDWAACFRASHTLKGVALNLSLDRLVDSASELTEALRDGEPSVDIEPLYTRVREDYQSAVSAISALG